MRTITLYSLLVLTSCGWLTNAAPAEQSLDGRDRNFKDDLLDNLFGDWNIARKTLFAEATLVRKSSHQPCRYRLRTSPQ